MPHPDETPPHRTTDAERPPPRSRQGGIIDWETTLADAATTLTNQPVGATTPWVRYLFVPKSSASTQLTRAERTWDTIKKHYPGVMLTIASRSPVSLHRHLHGTGETELIPIYNSGLWWRLEQYK